MPEPTQKQSIIYHLKLVGRPLAVHEFALPNVSQNSIATRLSELAKAGQVFSRVRKGKPYKEWSTLQFEAQEISK